MPRFPFFVVRLARFVGALAPLVTVLSAARADIRPLVVVFAATVDPAGAGIGVQKAGNDGLTPEVRTGAGTRFFASCMNDSNALIAVRYDPRLSMVVRAEAEANLHIVNADDPTPAERLQIAQAMGSVYLIAVSTQAPADAPGGTIEMTIEGVGVGDHKTYSDHVRMSAGKTMQRNTGNGLGDSDAIRHFSGNDQIDNALQSAANTLATRLLAGPLHEYTRSVAPPALLPATGAAAPSPDVLRPTLPVPAPSTAAENANPVAPKTAPAPTAPAVPTVPGDPRFGDLNTSTPVVTKTTHIDGTVKLSAPGSGPTPPDSHTYANAAQHGAGAPDEEAKAAISQSATLLSDGDPASAILMLREAIDQQPLSAPLRVALAQTYLTAHHDRDAESEARRALTVLPALAPTVQNTLTDILGRSISANGSGASARETYSAIFAQQPTAYWAAVSLAALDLEEGQTAEAEKEFRTVLHAEPAMPGAVAGLAQMLMEQGDFDGAQAVLTAAHSAEVQSAAAVAVFDKASRHIAENMVKNRAAWEAKNLSRDALFTATTAQASRVTALLTLLKANPPTPGAANERALKRRVLAANLLAQATNDFLNFLQTSDADAGANSTLQLGEFEKELTEAQGMGKG